MAKVTLDTPLPTLSDVAELFGLTDADMRRINRIVTESGSGRVQRSLRTGRFTALKKISSRKPGGPAKRSAGNRAVSLKPAARQPHA